MRDYLIRRDQAAAARGEAPCACGHVNREHRELERETIDLEASVAAGHLVVHPNPAYRPLHFHCSVEGCDCVIRRT